jgi:hypothetical protein
MAANGASLEAVTAAYDGWLALANEEALKKTAPLGNRVRLALYVGDLAAADKALVELEEYRASDPSESYHDMTHGLRMDLAEEQGDFDRSLALADAYVAKSAAWQHDPLSGVALRRPWLLERLGRATHGEVVAQMPAIVERVQHDFTSDAKMEKWIEWQATAAQGWNQDEAAEALTLMPPPAPEMGIYADFQKGHLATLAGQYSKAIPLLQRYASSCLLMGRHGNEPWGDILIMIQAKADLGKALENSQDVRGACRAFGYVRERWKNGSKRSVSLNAANERFAALHCSELPAATEAPK